MLHLRCLTDFWMHLSQQTFLLMKMSLRRLYQDEYIRLSHTPSEDVLIKTNILVLVIRFHKVFKTYCKSVFKTPLRCLEDVLKISWRNLQDIFDTSWQDVFKASSRRIAKMSSRHLQDVPSKYHQVKMFLLTCLQDVFETYSTRFWDVLWRKFSTEKFAYVRLVRNLGSGCKISKGELFGDNETFKTFFLKPLYEVAASTNKDVIDQV